MLGAMDAAFNQELPTQYTHLEPFTDGGARYPNSKMFNFVYSHLSAANLLLSYFV